MKKRDLQIGDVVQISPEGKYSASPFGGMLLVVTEPKEWGCQGYLMSATEFTATKYKGVAYLRPEWADMEYVGRLEWLREDTPDES